jgi:hypothetical protein
MKIWIGLQCGGQFVFERTEVVHAEDEVADVVRDALLDYAEESGQRLSDLTIKIGRPPGQDEVK